MAVPRILLPRLLDQAASETPDSIFAEVCEQNWREAGPVKYTFSQVAQAVDNVSFWLDKQLGHSKVFAYFGASDLRYTFLVVAAVKTQRTIVIPDGRLTPEARVDLLRQARCHHWIASSDHLEAAESLLGNGITVHFMPSLKYWLHKGEQYPYTKTFDEVKDDIAWVIHTSGTTGNPKALLQSNAFLASLQWHQKLGEDFENPEMVTYAMLGSRSVWLAPPQWSAGIFGYVCAPLYWKATVLIPYQVADVDDIHKTLKPDGGFYMPSILKNLAKDPDNLARLRSLKYVCYAGAPLDRWVGDLLYGHTFLVPVVGSTESGPIMLRSSDEDWSYYNFDSKSGIEFEPYGDQLELVFRKNDFTRYQPIFDLYNDKQTHPSSDLYEKHPTKELYRYTGRKDDLFKLAWLEKVNAGNIESSLERDSRIRGCLVGGEARPEPFVLVEGDGISMDELWELLEQNNAKNVVHIPRKNVVLVDCPLKRLAKGTIDRKKVLEDYKAVIERLYSEPA